MRIESVSEVPEIPTRLEGRIPVLGDTDDSSFGNVGTFSPPRASRWPDDVELPGPVLSNLDSYADLLRSTEVPVRASLIDRAATWDVTDFHESEGGIEVVLGRAGAQETSFFMSDEMAGDLEIGEHFLWPADDLPALRGRQELHVARRLLGTISVVVEFRPDEASDPVEMDVWLPLLRVHNPQHAGCEAEYEIATSDSHEGTMELTLAGAGGGAGQHFTLKTSSTYGTKSSCIEIAVPAKLRLQLGSTLVDGTEVAYGMRATIVDVKAGDLTERDLPAHSDLCQWPMSDLSEPLWKLDRRGSSAGADELQWNELEIERVTEGKVTVGLDLGSVPLKLGMEYVRTTSDSAAVKTGVSPGASYVAYAPGAVNGIEICWTTVT